MARVRAKEIIDLYGERYEIKIPTVKEAMEFDKDLSDPGSDKLKVTVGFLVKIGLPKKTIFDIEADHLSLIIDTILGLKNKVGFSDFQLAKMARFYGWDHEYLCNMQSKIFMSYYRAISPIEASEQINQLTASDWPNLKDIKRKEIFGKLDKEARSVYPKKQVKFTKELLESIINQHTR